MKIVRRIAALSLALGLVPALSAKDLTDVEFVTKAASGGMFEVESSKLAKESAKSAEVKKFAERMIADHGKANAELTAAAKKAGLEVPAKMAEPETALFGKLKGAADFDRAYLEAQVKAHEDAVMLFEAATKSLQDAGLKAFAEKTLPTIKEHLQHVKKHAKGE